MFQKIIHYFLHNRLVTMLLLIGFVGWGLSTAPFNWDTGFLPKNPVPVDAIPDIGENQQNCFYWLAGKISPRCGRSDYVSFDDFIIRDFRSEVYSQYFNVWFFKHLYHF